MITKKVLGIIDIFGVIRFIDSLDTTIISRDDWPFQPRVNISPKISPELAVNFAGLHGVAAPEPTECGWYLRTAGNPRGHFLSDWDASVQAAISTSIHK